ncbi:MAG: G5 domain-containing protein [Anaerolineales bacterium]
MKLGASVSLACSLALGACAVPSTPSLLLLDGSRPPVAINSGVPVEQALAAAGAHVQKDDHLMFNGEAIGVSDVLAARSKGVLQVKHAFQITVNGRPAQTSAETVGQALAEAGHDLYAADALDPPAATRLEAGMAISYTPSTSRAVSVDGEGVQIRSAAPSVEQSLAEAGLALVGLDTANTPKAASDPSKETITLTRVAESFNLEAVTIAFPTEFRDSPDVGLGQERIVQAGAPGLALSRTKVVYQDGTEVSRTTEPQAVVRAPQARLVARGTKVIVQTSNINGASVSYWLKTQMYATIYSPCNSDTGSADKCSYGTASGLRAGKGVVAVDPTLYASLNGQRLYIPGYGFAVIGDLGGGYIFENSTGISRYKWIDLGFDDGNVEDMSGWITVYFLAPAPATIPSVLK